jgi:NADH:ubiquinone oxidoreductase subunit
MKQFIAELFIWWHKETLSLRIKTWLRGQFVGTDELGNRYYTDKSGKRWVIYNGPAEASAIPPGWHGWMHHRVDTPPTEEHYQARSWQKPHLPNMTGTAAAYRPEGSLLNAGSRPKVTGDYDAWSPE